MVSSQVIAFIRRITNTYLTETCTIEGRTGGINAMGDPEETFDVVASGVRCRVITEKGMTAVNAEPVAGREALVDSYRIILPAGTEIGDDYRVTVGVDIYDVFGVLDDRTDEIDIQVRAVRVRAPE